jgi:hypothetical protein
MDFKGVGKEKAAWLNEIGAKPHKEWFCFVRIGSVRMHYSYEYIKSTPVDTLKLRHGENVRRYCKCDLCAALRDGESKRVKPAGQGRFTPQGC